MRIDMTMQHGSACETLSGLLQRQLGFALGHFRSRLRAVRLRLSDLNAAKGGLDKRGRLTVWFSDGGSVAAEAVDSSYEGVIHRGVDRIARQIERRVARARTKARSAASVRKRATGVGN